MRAFEISLNGKKLCVAGVGDDGVLTAIVSWVTRRDEDDPSFEVGALLGLPVEHAEWIQQKPLRINDEIRVRLVDTTQVDEPVRRYRHQANPPRDRHIGGIIGPY